MSASNEFREYENGVADIMACVVGARGTVRRNVQLPAGTGGRTRQIDVLVEGSLFGLTRARMIVDCKRWKRRVDVGDVDAFAGLLEDVRADAGMLISSSGASEGARERADALRGVRLQSVSLAELRSWRPRGTVFATIELAHDDVAAAAGALREIGLRVVTGTGQDQDDARVQVEVFRHHGVDNPSADVQQTQHNACRRVLDRLGVGYRWAGHGIVFTGGTPAHRWLPVTAGGAEIGLKVLAATEEEIGRELDRLASGGAIARGCLDVVRPAGWPFGNSFAP